LLFTAGWTVPRIARHLPQGDPADQVWIVGRGEVKIVRHDEGGQEVILEVIRPGEAFGGRSFYPSIRQQPDR
jgi:CRP-like cAMP-binding protein